jgi:hypothetical protein
MTAVKQTYYKAWFLLIVFSLNSIISFACSLSSLFHGFHHHSITTEHNNEQIIGHHHSLDKSGEHHHDQEQGGEQSQSPSSSEDCCSKSLVEVEKVDKSISRTIQLPEINIFTSFFLAYTPCFLWHGTEEKTFLTYHVRWRPPATIQDLRIVIQSFQI